MWTAIGLICGFACLIGIVILLSFKYGSKAAKLEVLKHEAKERARANKIMDTVRSMSDDDVRARLQNLSDK
jgi:flagellar motility protein MotE (MotC chaperone)